MIFLTISLWKSRQTHVSTVADVKVYFLDGCAYMFFFYISRQALSTCAPSVNLLIRKEVQVDEYYKCLVRWLAADCVILLLIFFTWARLLRQSSWRERAHLHLRRTYRPRVYYNITFSYSFWRINYHLNFPLFFSTLRFTSQTDTFHEYELLHAESNAFLSYFNCLLGEIKFILNFSPAIVLRLMEFNVWAWRSIYYKHCAPAMKYLEHFNS